MIVIRIVTYLFFYLYFLFILAIAAKREVPTTIIPGQEGMLQISYVYNTKLISTEVPDNEPIRQEFAAEVEHQMQSFPFLEVDLYRYVLRTALPIFIINIGVLLLEYRLEASLTKRRL